MLRRAPAAGNRPGSRHTLDNRLQLQVANDGSPTGGASREAGPASSPRASQSEGLEPLTRSRPFPSATGLATQTGTGGWRRHNAANENGTHDRQPYARN